MTTMQEKPEVEVEVNTLHIMDDSGDTRITWDPSKPFEVEQAKNSFDAHKQKGYLAYTVQGDGTKGEVIREFDPNAKATIMAPQHVGG